MSMEDGEFLNAKQEDGSFKGPLITNKIKLSLY